MTEKKSNNSEKILELLKKDIEKKRTPTLRRSPKKQHLEIKSFITSDCHGTKLDIIGDTPILKYEWYTHTYFDDYIMPYNKVYSQVSEGEEMIWEATDLNDCGLKVEVFYLLDQADMVIILKENLGLHIFQKYKCEECEKMEKRERTSKWINTGGCEKCKQQDEWVDVSKKYLDPLKFSFYAEDGDHPDREPMEFEVSLGGYNYEIILEKPCKFLTYGDRILFDQNGETKGLSINIIRYHLGRKELNLKLSDGRTLTRKFVPENPEQYQTQITKYFNEECFNISVYCQKCTSDDFIFLEPIIETRFKKSVRKSSKRKINEEY
ncbi:uncharacterized protein TA03290 [Theileria annulata]|uniref:Uncharacterized protein n=1 Tax=Theileria annulata TaxID=5874 RepID=Q4UCN6_THEAN|nr:uncharacterized protein TA03290 [Theileria annulata]CAI75415.1 hypothetical protein TA03290 [Theileria annulata]|eukprot:XP_954891.1 hypothetical protein TA03290 [Theileria annulata]